jgi:hypothetical protein
MIVTEDTIFVLKMIFCERSTWNEDNKPFLFFCFLQYSCTGHNDFRWYIFLFQPFSLKTKPAHFRRRGKYLRHRDV